MRTKIADTWKRGTDEQRQARGVVLGVFALPLFCTLVLLVIQLIVH